MPITRLDVEAAAKTVFPPGDARSVLAILDLYGIEPHEPERERVQLAILALCEGDEARLRSLVRTAKTDYRDVLSWVETGPLSDEEGRNLRALARSLLEKWGRK